MSQFDEPGEMPIIFANFQWSFAPGIRERDKEPLKRIFAAAANQWLMENIRVAVTEL
jgi:hypothetical protein